MADEEKDKSDALRIAELVLAPDAEQLPGFTRIPLDQVRPCAYARVFAREEIDIAKIASKSQELYGKNWLFWHSEETKIPGLGIRKPPLNGGNGKDGKFFPDGVMEKPPAKNDPRFIITELEDSLVVEYLRQYYLLRRSTTPDFTMGAFELAAREVEGEPKEGEGWDKVINQ